MFFLIVNHFPIKCYFYHPMAVSFHYLISAFILQSYAFCYWWFNTLCPKIGTFVDVLEFKTRILLYLNYNNKVCWMLCMIPLNKTQKTALKAYYLTHYIWYCNTHANKLISNLPSFHFTLSCIHTNDPVFFKTLTQLWTLMTHCVWLSVTVNTITSHWTILHL